MNNTLADSTIAKIHHALKLKIELNWSGVSLRRNQHLRCRIRTHWEDQSQWLIGSNWYRDIQFMTENLIIYNELVASTLLALKLYYRVSIDHNKRW